MSRLRHIEKGQHAGTGRPRKGRAWFERKVSELKEILKQLPPDRREQARRMLEDLDAETQSAPAPRGLGLDNIRRTV